MNAMVAEQTVEQMLAEAPKRRNDEEWERNALLRQFRLLVACEVKDEDEASRLVWKYSDKLGL